MLSVIHSARLVTRTETVPDAWVAFDGDRVSATGIGDSWQQFAPAKPASAPELIDARGRWLTPGFIDLHCHGAGGGGVHEGPEAIATTLDVHLRHGTTRAVLSLATGPLAGLERALGEIAAASRTDPRLLGAHLEGPFLSTEFRGAHNAELLRDPAPDILDSLLAAADGTLVQLTLAPEREHALAAIDRLIAAGVVVAVGHSAADFALASRAFDRGASILTHAFNGMRGIHHRAPGPVLAAMRADHVTLELINDTIHVHPAVVRLAFDGAPGRIALITDAMAATGSHDGEYLLANQTVEVRDGIARVKGTDSLAGSTLTLDVAVRNAVVQSGISLNRAVAAVTETPAAAIHHERELGRLDPGFAADAVLLDDDLTVTQVWSAGTRVQ